MKNISKSTRLIAAIASMVCAGSINANTVTAVVGGAAESGAIYQNFDTLTAGQTGTIPLLSGLTIVLGTNTQAATNANNFASSTPLLSGNNNQFFGPIYSGYDTTTFLAGGKNGINGVMTFNFSSAQTYFGLFWGSVDATNTLTFYSGANGTGLVLQTVTGQLLNTINPQVAATGFGDPFNPWGSAYVNVNTTLGFQSVVATTGTFTFEIENVAFGTASVPNSVPDAASTGVLLLAALGGLVLFGKSSQTNQPV